MEAKQFRIYVDMDRVLFDFDKGFQKIRESEGLTYPQSKLGFFTNLDLLPGALDAYKYLHDKYDTWILTRPSFFNLNCYTEKAESVRNNFGLEVQKKLILCGNKSLVIGDVLIDDHHTDGQPDFEGTWIQFGTEKYPDWNSVIKKVDELFKLRAETEYLIRTDKN